MAADACACAPDQAPVTTSRAAACTDPRPLHDVAPTAVGAQSGGARIRRLLARFIGIGYLAYLAVTAAQIGHGGATVAWWWTPAALVVAVGPGIALSALSFRAGPAAERAIRITALCAVAGYGAAAVSWLPAWAGDAVSGSSSTWLVRFSGLVGLCAALIWRPVWVAAVQVVATAGSSVINQTALMSPDPLWLRVCTETVWAVGFSGVFVAATIMAVRTSYLLDATEISFARAAATAAASAARERERAKFDALVHDRVLAVLLEAARTTTPHRIPAQARAALSALDEVAASSTDEVVTATAVIDGLRAVITPISESVTLSVAGVEDLASVYPLDAVSAVTDAASEAVRNSIVHAGTAAQTQVALDITTDSLGVVILDRGRGFDPQIVTPGRLGIEHSITGRMTQIPGGRSAITTGVGSGTRVELHWTRTTTSAAAPDQARGVRRITGPTTRLPPAEVVSDLIGITSRWSIAVAAIFLLCAAVATVASITAGMDPAAAIGSLTVLAAGIWIVITVDGDPLNRRWAGACALTAPVQIVLAATGLSEPIGDPLRNAAALSGGLVVCAFLCARGSAGWAWTGHLASCALYTAWTLRAGLDAESASQVVIPAVAVMTAATVFAALLRPAAREVFSLRAAQTVRAAERAAAVASIHEHRRQTARLDDLARPALGHLTEHPSPNSDDKQVLVLLEARLRDGIRARTLDTPALTEAVWDARARGVAVILLDDGALDGCTPEITLRLHHSIVEHLQAARSGTTMTVRITPPRRPHLATITVTTTSGESIRHEYDHTASPITTENFGAQSQSGLLGKGDERSR
ncbi:hypothetical protein O4220_24090 [Rhodococcus ruber]|uniref:ATP-binding protein n=1 Tax=Rhodococcus ruber TaxID=1830 RepID=A0ABT4MKV6_9NOCA|nr:hypothetical protein [Rhodococcus ruber]MCZ4521612.1 hypothetical protein [Rhodococcus ruber]